jgi:hypothetical protein
MNPGDWREERLQTVGLSSLSFYSIGIELVLFSSIVAEAYAEA